jgi:hypothetical protein
MSKNMFRSQYLRVKLFLYSSQWIKVLNIRTESFSYIKSEKKRPKQVLPGGWGWYQWEVGRG